MSKLRYTVQMLGFQIYKKIHSRFRKTFHPTSEPNIDSEPSLHKSSQFTPIYTSNCVIFKITEILKMSCQPSSLLKLPQEPDSSVPHIFRTLIQRNITLIYQTDVIFALFSMHFIVESSYFTRWRGMHQRENIYLKK